MAGEQTVNAVSQTHTNVSLVPSNNSRCHVDVVDVSRQTTQTRASVTVSQRLATAAQTALQQLMCDRGEVI